MLAAERVVQGVNLHGLPPERKGAFGMAKLRAATVIPILEGLLGLRDDDAD